MNDLMNFNNTKRAYYDSQISKKVLINGYNCLNNAKLCQIKGEYYILVNYQEEERLPEEYVPISEEIIESFGFDKSEHFATANPELNFTILNDDSRIKRITRVGIVNGFDSQYLIGLGPESFTISDLIEEQLEAYKRERRVR